MQNYVLYKAEKPSVCPSVRLSIWDNLSGSVWIDLELGMCIAESFEMCIDVFLSFYQLSAGRRSIKETMMLSN